MTKLSHLLSQISDGEHHVYNLSCVYDRFHVIKCDNTNNICDNIYVIQILKFPKTDKIEPAGKKKTFHQNPIGMEK